MADAVLLFLDALGEIEGWLLIADGRVAARGRHVEGMPLPADEVTGRPAVQILIAPGEAVALHWLEVPGGLAPAQAAAAGRLIAADVSTQPLDQMHVAVGAEIDGRGERIVAITPAVAMAGWLSRLEPHGFDPDIVLPEPLLLPAPDDGFVRYERGERPLYRGQADAFAIEPGLAAVVTGDALVRSLDAEAFEAGLATAISRPAINLRQGPFAKRRRWSLDWTLIRRLALIGLAILIVTLATQLAAILRYSAAADAAEEEARSIAGEAAPGAATSADPGAKLRQRLVELRAPGMDYGVLAATLFGAINATANAELGSLSYERDGSLAVTIAADSPATLAAVQERVRASGFAAEMGPPRTEAGRQLAEMRVTAQ